MSVEYEMDVIGHEAEGQDVHGGGMRVMSDQADEDRVVIVSEERLLAIIAALRDV